MAFTDFLTERVTLQRQSIGSRDTSGGVVQAWTTVAEDVPAHVMAPSASQRVQYAQLQMVVPYTIFTERDDARNGDRVLLDDGTYVRLTGISRTRAAGSLSEFWEWAGEEVKP